MRKQRIAFYSMTALLLLLSIGIFHSSKWMPGGFLQVQAAEQEKVEELELTGEDVTAGRIRIPAGVYQRILIRGSVRDAAVYMKDVVVEEYMSLYGGASQNITVIVSGDTNIRKLIAKRNVTLASLDSKQHIQTLSVRDAVKIHLLANIVNFSIPTGVKGVHSEIGGTVDYLADKGEGNYHAVYANIAKAKLEGTRNALIVCEQIERVYLQGEGNRVMVRADVERAIVNGKNVVLSVDEEEVQIKKVQVTGGTCKLIRPERFGSLQDESTKQSTSSCHTLFIGDSHTEGLYTRGYLKKGTDSLFGRGTAAAHWYVNGRKHLNYLNQLADYHPQKIVYMYGVNGIQSDSNIKYSKQLLQRLMKEYPDAVIYVQRVLPVGDNYPGTEEYQYELFNKNGRLNVTDFNKEMEKFCKNYTQLLWTDTSKGLIDKNGNLVRGLTDDGLHLNDAGYKIWWSNIEEAIQN